MALPPIFEIDAAEFAACVVLALILAAMMTL